MTGTSRLDRRSVLIVLAAALIVGTSLLTVLSQVDTAGDRVAQVSSLSITRGETVARLRPGTSSGAPAPTSVWPNPTRPRSPITQVGSTSSSRWRRPASTAATSRGRAPRPAA